MKMRSNTDLWSLVQALTKSEKRYFRRYTTLRGSSEDKIYLQLFNLLVSQVEYDTIAVQEAMDDEQFSRRYSAHKNYLQGLILKSMRSYNAEKFMVNRIQGLVADGIFLFHKTLYAQSRKRFQKAEKLAREVEYFVQLPEILLWQRRLIKRMREKNRLEKLERVAFTYKEVLEHLQEEQEWHQEYERLYAESQRDPSGGRAAPDESTDYLQNQKIPVGFQARHHFYQARIFQARLQKDWKTAFEWQIQQLDHWLENPAMCKEEPGRFSAIVANFLAVATQLKNWEKFQEIRPELDKIRFRSELETLQTRQQGLFLDLLYHLNRGTFLEGLLLVPSIEKWLGRHGKILHKTREMAFLYNLAMLAFLGGDRKRAMKWCNELLNSGREDVRLDIQAALHFVQFLLFVEIGDPDLVEGKYRSLGRFLKLHYPNSFLSWLLPRVNQAFKDGGASLSTYLEWQEDMNKVVEVFHWEDQTGLNELKTWLDQKINAHHWQPE